MTDFLTIDRKYTVEEGVTLRCSAVRSAITRNFEKKELIKSSVRYRDVIAQGADYIASIFFASVAITTTRVKDIN